MSVAWRAPFAASAGFSGFSGAASAGFSGFPGSTDGSLPSARGVWK